MGWDWKPSSPPPVTYSSSKSQPAKGLQTEQPTRPNAQIHEPVRGHFLFKPPQNLIKWKLLILSHIKGLMGLEGEPGSLRWETTEGLKHQIKWIYFSPVPTGIAWRTLVPGKSGWGEGRTELCWFCRCHSDPVTGTMYRRKDFDSQVHGVEVHHWEIWLQGQCPSWLEHVLEMVSMAAGERGERAGWKHGMGCPFKACPSWPTSAAQILTFQRRPTPSK